jgi:hypothetical protein
VVDLIHCAPLSGAGATQRRPVEVGGRVYRGRVWEA